MALPYGAVVLEHFRRPRNQRVLERPTASRDGYNPLCGDRVRVEVAIDAGVIRDAAFTANACAICTASASLLTERIVAVTIDDALGITDHEILAALDAELPAARRQCALLPATALRDALAALRSPA